MGVAALIAGWRAYKFFFSEEEDLSFSAKGGLEIGGISGTKPDHVVISEVERPLEFRQVGGVNVVKLRKRNEARTRTFRGLSCCGSRVTLHSKESSE